ncbi:TetR/AcrR family transcriptional regulator [Streptomyces sp. NPDC050617]|uniref:TetR/AcrR family transcriptional regulator n=1 Tax=Streptomyces sp. NPDC050617 TaxID=3154628 RepID=UPI0034180B3D
MDDDEARSRVLETADELFYQRGITAVGMAEVRDGSEVSLARLYKLYPSKHHLAAAYLQAHGKQLRARLAEAVERAAPASEGSRARLLAAFDDLRGTIEAPGFRGCAFVNAWAELGGNGRDSHPLVTEAVQEHKTLFRDYLVGLAEDYADPRAIGERMHVLMEGAMVTSALLGADAADQARIAASAVLDAAETGAGAGAEPGPRSGAGADAAQKA